MKGCQERLETAHIDESSILGADARIIRILVPMLR